MAKIETPQVVNHFSYNLGDPNHLSLIRNFEKELNQFTGPWKWELYCVHKGYFMNAEIEKVTVQGEVYERPVASSYQIRGQERDIDGKRFTDATDSMKDDEEKYKALKALLAKRSHAKQVNNLTF